MIGMVEQRCGSWIWDCTALQERTISWLVNRRWHGEEWWQVRLGRNPKASVGEASDTVLKTLDFTLRDTEESEGY